MRHLTIKSIGPVKSADIYLKQVNVIIGPQSLGKSTVLKLASFCTWVEKRIELTQRPEEFSNGERFKKELEVFHKMKGYFHVDSFISYESEHMKFSYEFSKDQFSFEWGEGRWNYHRAKISYIPAERNLVAAIPNWFEVTLERNNIRNFMTEWETARKYRGNNVPILNLSVDYHYEPENKLDKVRIQNGDLIEMTYVSSGLQSLIPLYIHLNYLYTGLYDSEKGRKVAGDWDDDVLSSVLYRELFVSKGRTKSKKYASYKDEKGNAISFPILYPLRYGTHQFVFSDKEDAVVFDQYLNNYMLTDHCEIFLEEPENNLFPPTQMRLARWLYDMTLAERPNTIFVATHSPYVLSAFLESDSEIGLFFLDEIGGSAVVKVASKEDCQAIIDYGVDAFFNIDNLGE